MAIVPVISSHVLKGLPEFARSAIGERALQRANRAAGLDVELIEDQNCFIPQQAVVDFVDAIGRAAGEPNLGLLIAPAMDAAAYGSFGRYVFGASTLGQAIERSIAALPYHSTYDTLSVAAVSDEVRYSYAFALAGANGYAAVAVAAAGVLLSIFRSYLPESWRPLRIELDIEPPLRATLFEDVFRCPMIFNAPAVTIVVERRHLTAASKRLFQPVTTIEDVARDRRCGAPRSLLGVAVEQIRARLLDGGAPIDEIARSMDTSVRTLQRELHDAGTDFRSLTTAITVQRAVELLRCSNGSITRISAELGYASPAGFSRAFRKATGLGPREFRTRGTDGRFAHGLSPARGREA
jgi:AraC-like DNA-binding protein